MLTTSTNDQAHSPMSTIPTDQQSLVATLTELGNRLHPKSSDDELEQFLKELQSVADILHPGQYSIFPKVVSFTDGTNKKNITTEGGKVQVYKPEYSARAEFQALLNYPLKLSLACYPRHSPSPLEKVRRNGTKRSGTCGWPCACTLRPAQGGSISRFMTQG
jgi:hypothetical protein